MNFQVAEDMEGYRLSLPHQYNASAIMMTLNAIWYFPDKKISFVQAIEN